MPYYDYMCEKCNEEFEKWTSFSSVDKINEIPVSCSRCGSFKTKRKISVPSVIFKGDGFYKNDSKKPPEKNK